MTPFEKRARELIPCTCAPDYTLRGREDPQCFWCQHGDDVLQLAEEFEDARDAFEQGYCERSKITVERGRKLGLRAALCDCGEDSCAGWRMVSQ